MDDVLSARPQGDHTAGEMKADGPVWVLLAVDWAFGVWLYLRLPPRVPLHWTLQGEADHWGPPGLAAFLIPALVTLIYAGFALAMTLGLGNQPSSATFRRQLRLIVPAFLVALHGILYVGMGLDPQSLPAPSWRIMLMAFALLLLGLGNLVPVVEPRGQNRERWRRAFRLGGRAMVAAGLLQVLTLWLPGPYALGIALSSTLAAMIFPYLDCRRLPGELPRLQSVEEKPTGLLHAADLLLLLPMGALLLPRVPHGLLALVTLDLLWLLLFLEASRTRLAEIRRVRVQMRGWILLGCSGALLPSLMRQRAGVLSLVLGLCALLLPPLLGQYLARRSADAEARRAWGEGFILWDPSDPRLLVPKAVSVLGATFNFAHLGSWILALGLTLPFLALLG